MTDPQVRRTLLNDDRYGGWCLVLSNRHTSRYFRLRTGEGFRCKNREEAKKAARRIKSSALRGF